MDNSRRELLCFSNNWLHELFFGGRGAECGVHIYILHNTSGCAHVSTLNLLDVKSSTRNHLINSETVLAIHHVLSFPSFCFLMSAGTVKRETSLFSPLKNVYSENRIQKLGENTILSFHPSPTNFYLVLPSAM